MEKVITTSAKKSYVQPSCETFAVAAEWLMVTGSPNLPGGSTGTDMGGGEDEEPITIGGAKSSNLWEETGLSVWDN